MFPILGSGAVHQCWAVADLYETQTCTGVTVLTQGCCLHGLQGSIEPESIFSILGSGAVDHCWAVADLYEKKICFGMTVLTQRGCLHGLQGSIEPESMFSILGSGAVDQVGQLQTCMKRTPALV